MSNGISTPPKSSSPESEMDCSMTPRSGMTVSPSTETPGADLWISSLRDFLASHSVTQARDSQRTTRATDGQPRSASFARYDPGLPGWKTFQDSFLSPTLELFSESWPKRGIVSNGIAYRLRKSARRTKGNGSGYSLPTPTANPESPNKNANTNGPKNLLEVAQGKWDHLFPTPKAASGTYQRSPGSMKKKYTLIGMALHNLWPTPSATMHKGSSQNALTRKSGKSRENDRLDHAVFKQEMEHTGNGGKLNPEWVEMLMGWPRGWTSLNPISVIEFTKWLMGFGGSNETKERSRKVLRGMWKEVGEKALQEAIRGLSNISEAESLLFALREYEGDSNEAWLQLACPSSSEEELRSLWMLSEIASASYRSRQNKQSTSEYTDALQILSRFLARYGKEDWQGGSWENAEPRVAENIKNRMDRLKAIGNGQVPAVVRAAWNTLGGSK